MARRWRIGDGGAPAIRTVEGPPFGISVVMWATDLTDEDYWDRWAALNLIAAAPELLEALEDLFDRANHHRSPYGEWFTDDDDNREALARAEHVIEKANGGTP